jgi:hypothetical protein
MGLGLPRDERIDKRGNFEGEGIIGALWAFFNGYFSVENLMAP